MEVRISKETRVWSLYCASDRGQYDGLSKAEVVAIVMVLSHEDRSNWHAYKVGWNGWKPLRDCSQLLSLSHLSRTKISYTAPEFGQVFTAAPEPESEPVLEDLSQKNDKVDSAQGNVEFNFEITASALPLELEDEAESRRSQGGERRNILVDRRVEVSGNFDESKDRRVSIGERRDSASNRRIQKKKRRAKKDKLPLAREAILVPISPGQGEVTAVTRILNTSENRRDQRYELKLHAEIICQDRLYQTFTRDISLGGVAVSGYLPIWVAGYCTIVLSTLDMQNRLEFICSVVENQKGKNFRLELHPAEDSLTLKEWLEIGLPQTRIKKKA